MNDLDDLKHAAARCRELCRVEQPLAAYSIAMDDEAAGYLRMVPEHCRAGLARHVLFGIKPGDFLNHVLCNDLLGALGHADHINRETLFSYGLFLHNAAPHGSYGSRELVDEWRARGGWFGRKLAEIEGLSQ